MTTDNVVVDVSQDWILACDVQERFMQGPVSNNGSVDCGARCRQARAIGGDCYDFMPLAENRLAMVVGDASGKGLAAALMMANVQSSLRTAAFFAGDDLASLLHVVNRQAYTSSLADRYATVFYGVFDRATRKLRYVNAGHNPPMVVRRDGSIECLEPGGAPVGMFPDSIYQEGMVQLEPGDLVIAYTDGLIEAMGASGAEWGISGLLEATSASSRHAGNAEELVRAVFEAMDGFSAGRQTDDATLAMMRVE
jgi:sigma-B regulation protein RsbU (phosphoserine phosphatase)